MHGKHLKGMTIAGGGLLGVLLLSGVPFGRALGYAASLACPLIMVGMMAMMGRGHKGHTGHSSSSPDNTEARAEDNQQHAST